MKNRDMWAMWVRISPYTQIALLAQLARAADSDGVVYRDKPDWYRLVV